MNERDKKEVNELIDVAFSKAGFNAKTKIKNSVASLANYEAAVAYLKSKFPDNEKLRSLNCAPIRSSGGVGKRGRPSGDDDDDERALKRQNTNATSPPRSPSPSRMMPPGSPPRSSSPPPRSPSPPPRSPSSQIHSMPPGPIGKPPGPPLRSPSPSRMMPPGSPPRSSSPTSSVPMPASEKSSVGKSAIWSKQEESEFAGLLKKVFSRATPDIINKTLAKYKNTYYKYEGAKNALEADWPEVFSPQAAAGVTKAADVPGRPTGKGEKPDFGIFRGSNEDPEAITSVASLEILMKTWYGDKKLNLKRVPDEMEARFFAAVKSSSEQIFKAGRTDQKAMKDAAKTSLSKLVESHQKPIKDVEVKAWVGWIDGQIVLKAMNNAGKTSILLDSIQIGLEIKDEALAHLPLDHRRQPHPKGRGKLTTYYDNEEEWVADLTKSLVDSIGRIDIIEGKDNSAGFGKECTQKLESTVKPRNGSVNPGGDIRDLLRQKWKFVSITGTYNYKFSTSKPNLLESINIVVSHFSPEFDA